MTCKRCKKGTFSVNTDYEAAHAIAFEVTVPRIVLPFSPPAQVTKDTDAEPVEETEQVSLLMVPLHRRGNVPPITQAPDTTTEVTTHATTQGLFRLFRLKIAAIAGQLYLLRVRHIQRLQPNEAPGQRKSPPHYPPLIDDLACTIEFRSTTDDTARPHPKRLLTPGRHDIVVILNEEGIPASYCIDGAEG